MAICANSGLANAFPDEGVCDLLERSCIEEDFSSYPVSSYINVGNPYLSPNGFYFEILSGAGQYQIHNLTNIGNAIYIPGQVTVIELPQPANEVRFVLTGGGSFNFAAYDVNSTPVWWESHEVYGTAQAVHLSGTDIFHIVVSHTVSEASCDLDYGEPFIDQLEACETNFGHLCQ